MTVLYVVLTVLHVVLTVVYAQEASGMQVGARAPQAARAILLTP